MPGFAFFYLQSCTPCPAGQFCQNTTAVGKACPSGTYSLGKQTICTTCPSGYSCADSSKKPVVCPAGKYSNTSAITCTDCALGYLCEQGSTLARPSARICPMGSYCDDLLTAKPCPSGTYGNRTGATSQANGCASCPAGYFCIPGTVGYPSKALRCPPGHYCPAGTTTQYQYPCPNGKFSRNVGNERSDQCENCPVGYYCQGGDRTGDTLCPLGHYCPIGTASRSQHPCPAGYYTEEMGSRS